MATTIIDTGQSFGTDIKLQDGKIISSPRTNSEITIPLMKTAEPAVLGETTTKVTKSEIETFFSTQNGNVRVYKDASGQMYLSLQPVSVLMVLSAFFAFILVLFVVRILKSKVTSPKVKSKSHVRRLAL